MLVFYGGCGLVYDQCGWNKCMKVYNFGIFFFVCLDDIFKTYTCFLICRSWSSQLVL